MKAHAPTVALVSVAAVATASVLLTASPSPAGPASQPATQSAGAAAFDPFIAYDEALREFVDDDGWIDYAGLSERRGGLDGYVQWLAGVQTDGMSDDERLALLINAYNAFTLQLIVDHFDGGALESIMDLHDGKPWDREDWNLAGDMISLNQLEHEIIRKEFDEPRIHWAVVCAAFSCPPLRNEAYTGERLEAQLAEQEAYVLNLAHPRFAQVRDRQLLVTRLFEWYSGDFGAWEDYVMRRIDLAGETVLSSQIGFLDYDWRLNDVSNRPG